MKKEETERVSVTAWVSPPPLAMMIRLMIVGSWPSATKNFRVEEAFPPGEGVTGFTVKALVTPEKASPCSVRSIGELSREPKLS